MPDLSKMDGEQCGCNLLAVESWAGGWSPGEPGCAMPMLCEGPEPYQVALARELTQYSCLLSGSSLTLVPLSVAVE